MNIASVRVWIRTDADRQTIEACRIATGEATAAKALMAAAASYPAAKRRLEDAERELAELHRLRDELKRGLGLL